MIKNDYLSGKDEQKTFLSVEPWSDSGMEVLKKAREYVHEFIMNHNKVTTKRKTVKDQAHFLFSIEKGMHSLPQYATLHTDHVREIYEFKEQIKMYAQGPENTRPMNWVLLASPGEGKSHFIKCIAKRVENEGVNVKAVTFNMASMRNSEDLAAALDEARNAKVDDNVPLLFLDEFDNDPKNYGLLLPLLWDGELELGSKKLKLGRVIIVLAGSGKDLPSTMKKVRNIAMDANGIKKDLKSDENKLPDLISRINGGVVQIPPLTNPDGGSDRKEDKICIAVAMLRREFQEVMWVPARLLRFVHNTEFRYGVRSIQRLIDMIRGSDLEGLSKTNFLDENGEIELEVGAKAGKITVMTKRVLDLTHLDEIFNHEDRIRSDGIATHLHHSGGPDAVKNIWIEAARDKRYIPIYCDTFKSYGSPISWTYKNSGHYSFMMLNELGGEDRDEEGNLDLTAFAGVEPLHITNLSLNEEKGEWLHGQTRHIFFNIKTLHQILGGIEKSESSLENLGINMGRAFGADFAGFLSRQESSEKIDVMIQHWCDFDISGGWGKWEAPVVGPREGRIKIINNFLALEVEGIEKEKLRYCKVMEGYISGVLAEFIKYTDEDHEKVTVDVTEESCCLLNEGTDFCSFHYRIANKVV